MPMQSQALIAGVAKQSARGTIATDPTYAHGLTGGSPISVDVSQSAIDVTAGTRTQTNMIRDGVANGASIETLAYIQSLGMYLLGALGTDTVTGTTPKTHTYSTGDLPYLSIFAKGIGGTIEGIRDCKVDELTLKWDGSKPVDLSAKLLGTVFSYPSTFSATTDDTGAESFLVPVGGSFKIDTAGSTLAEARVMSGELTIKNNVGPIDPSANIEAQDVWEGVQEHTLKLTVVPDDLAEFRKTVTGGGLTNVGINSITFSTPTVTVNTASAHGLVAGQTVTIAGATNAANNVTATVLTASGSQFTITNSAGVAQASAAGTVYANVAGYVPTGSVSLTFQENKGTNTLKVTGSKVAFSTSFPDADPKGGAVQIELAGIAVGSQPLSYVLTNAIASY